MSVKRAGQNDVERYYVDDRAVVLRRLRVALARRGIRFDLLDLEAFYNYAWQSCCERWPSGNDVESRRDVLGRVAYFRAIEEWWRLRDGRLADPELVEWAPVEADPGDHFEHREILRHFFEALKGRLDPRDRELAVLIYLHGVSRRAAAERLQITEKQVQRMMDGTPKRMGLARRVDAIAREIGDGQWCGAQRSLVAAYAAGVLDVGGGRYQQARTHLAGCPSCRGEVRTRRGAERAGDRLVPATAAPV